MVYPCMVFTCRCVHGQRRIPGVLLYCSLLYSIDTWSVTEPGSRLTADDQQAPAILLSHPQLCWGYRCVHSHTQLLMYVLRAELRLSFLGSNCSYPPGYLLGFSKMVCNIIFGPNCFVGWCSLYSALGRQKQENGEFEATLGYTARPCLQKHK